MAWDEAEDRERHAEHADLGVLAADQRPDGLDGDVGREDEELDGDELLGAVLGGLDITREPVKRQMMITLAKPSIAESRPKPTSAIGRP